MKKIFAANWKLFKSPHETRSFFKEFLPQLGSISSEVIFFPPATSWEASAESLNKSAVYWGAQNIYCEGQGAFTGENSGEVLKSLGGRYALIGHSERRKIFSESLELIAKKMKFTLELGLTPLLCIGETLEEREANKTNQINSEQLKTALHAVSPGSNLVVAYEPVWAIGTGKVATPDQAQESHAFIKESLKALGFGETRVLYGGSVKPDNAKELLSRPGIDGFLVGGASLQVDSFLKICQS